MENAEYVRLYADEDRTYGRESAYRIYANKGMGDLHRYAKHVFSAPFRYQEWCGLREGINRIIFENHCGYCEYRNDLVCNMTRFRSGEFLSGCSVFGEVDVNSLFEELFGDEGNQF